MFRIQNVGSEDVEAACSFDYRGYLISVSTILKPHNVAILKDGEFVDTDISSVEWAIREVNMLLFTDSKQFKHMLVEYGIKVEDFTCQKCKSQLECSYAYDPYSTNGDCLASK